jgi:hypothetical protein
MDHILELRVGFEFDQVELLVSTRATFVGFHGEGFRTGGGKAASLAAYGRDVLLQLR